MVSCSQDETIDINTGKGISFRPEAHAGTRATEIKDNNLTGFWVTALQEDGTTYFDKVSFTGSQGNSYTSNPAYNWPGTGNLTFHAFYPSATDLGGTLTLDGTAQKLEGFKVKDILAEQKDLVYAMAVGNAADNEESGVNLKFYHQLAQISVKAKSSSEAYTYKVKGVKIAEIPSTADLTQFNQNPTWGTPTGNKTFTSDLATEVTLTEEAQPIMLTTDGTAMLIPQQLTAWKEAEDKPNNEKGAYLGVYIQITTTDGDHRVYPKNEGVDYAYACVPINTKWEAGNHYVYTLDFSNGAGYVDPEDPEDPAEPILGGAIKFTVSVEPWTTEGNGQDITMD